MTHKFILGRCVQCNLLQEEAEGIESECYGHNGKGLKKNYSEGLTDKSILVEIGDCGIENSNIGNSSVQGGRKFREGSLGGFIAFVTIIVLSIAGVFWAANQRNPDIKVVAAPQGLIVFDELSTISQIDDEVKDDFTLNTVVNQVGRRGQLEVLANTGIMGEYARAAYNSVLKRYIESGKVVRVPESTRVSVTHGYKNRIGQEMVKLEVLNGRHTGFHGYAYEEAEVFRDVGELARAQAAHEAATNEASRKQIADENERDKGDDAVKRHRKAAEQGQADAQVKLGLCYYNGKGIAKDYVGAAKWFRKAAEQGLSVAQYSLGVCYNNGEGVQKDYEEAAKWFGKAAEQGHAEAVKWCRQNADQGDDEDQKSNESIAKDGRKEELEYKREGEATREEARRAKEREEKALLEKKAGEEGRLEEWNRHLAAAENDYGSDSPHVTTPLNEIASVYQERGDYSKAEPLLKRALAINEKAFGGDSRIIDSLISLAILYQTQEDYSKAKPLFMRALAIGEKTLSDNAGFAPILIKLGEFYKSQGDYAKAEPLYKRALTLNNKAYGSDGSRAEEIRNKIAELNRLQAVPKDAQKSGYPESQEAPEKLAAGLIAAFLKHGEASDIQAELADYAAMVNPYFEQKVATRQEILADMEKYRRRWPKRTLSLIGVESANLAGDKTLNATYRFRYSAGDGKRNVSGEQIQSVRYTLTEGRWLVSGVQTVNPAHK